MILLKADGTNQKYPPANGKHYTLAELQAAVGGYIEIVHLDEGALVINEEGKLHGLPLNERASELYYLHNGPVDHIVGDALLCSEASIE